MWCEKLCRNIEHTIMYVCYEYKDKYTVLVYPIERHESYHIRN